MNHQTAGIVRSLDQIARIAEGERDDRWLGRKRHGERRFIEFGDQMIHGEGPTGSFTNDGELSFQVLGRPSETPEAP